MVIEAGRGGNRKAVDSFLEAGGYNVQIFNKSGGTMSWIFIIIF